MRPLVGTGLLLKREGLDKSNLFAFLKFVITFMNIVIMWKKYNTKNWEVPVLVQAHNSPLGKSTYNLLIIPL